MRSTLLACVIACTLWLTGCAAPAANPASPAPMVLQEGADGGAEAAEPVARPGKSEGAARVGEWIYKTPLNAVWWPWKIVGSGLRGIPDGVIAGFDKDRMPLLGLLVSPINAATGLLTGMVEGGAMGPAFITPDTDLGRTFGKPTQVPTTIWWY